MGLVIAIIVVPVVFAIVAVYVVVRLALLLVRLVFMPLALLRR
jgi:hypothetical protein